MKYIFDFASKTFRFCLGIVFKILGKELSDKTFDKLNGFVKFLVVGFINTLILFAVYYAVILTFGEEYYLYGQTAGYFAGVVNSYFLNSKYVFTYGQKGKSAFVKVCICYLLTYFLQAFLLYLFIDTLCMSEYASPIIAVVITTIINYFLNKIFAFGNKE